MLRVALHESMEMWDEHESVGEILLVNVSIKSCVFSKTNTPVSSSISY